jgi:hypothetical protein
MIEREVIEMYSNRTEDELIYFSAILSIASHSDDRERCNKIEDELFYSSVILSTASLS